MTITDHSYPPSRDRLRAYLIVLDYIQDCGHALNNDTLLAYQAITQLLALREAAGDLLLAHDGVRWGYVDAAVPHELTVDRQLDKLHAAAEALKKAMTPI